MPVPGALGFALVSVGERSFGAQVIGVEPAVEVEWSAIAAGITTGRYLEQPGEIVLGSLLARNLQLEVGDEVVLLGTARQGGVAAFAGHLVGIFELGSSELNRGLAQIVLRDFQEAWALQPNEAHAVVGIATSVAAGEEAARRLSQDASLTRAKIRVLNWRELMPEADQMRDMKVIGTDFFFVVLAIIVGFSVVNTFMMMVFERTREFGLMMAVGMRPYLFAGAVYMLKRFIYPSWVWVLA